MFPYTSSVNRLKVKGNINLQAARNVRIPLWEFLKEVAKSRSNTEASYHKKRIGGFQPIKTELHPKRTYYWCSCGYAQSQALCDRTCKQLRGDFRPLKFTTPKFQMADLCMCKATEKPPYCDQSCNKRFAGMQLRMGDSVHGTYSNFKEFLSNIPKGMASFQKFAADRQKQLERAEYLRKKSEKEKDKDDSK